jgi:class 3 adenylate cyclase
MTVTDAIRACRSFDPASSGMGVSECRSLADQALKLGEPLLAFDVLRSGLIAWPSDVRLRQLQALALARSGSAESARQTLLRLRAEGHSDAETLGLLARIYKDLANESADTSDSAQFRARAAEQYEESYRLHGSVWSAINAATLALCSGSVERAREFATIVQRLRSQELAANSSVDPYWSLADLGESSLILGNVEAAESYYSRATAIGRDRLGDLAASRRNAKLICRELGIEGALIKEWLPLPGIILFSGHMIDRPDRPVPRFPSRLEAPVAAEIRRRVEAVDAKIGYSCAACGADILFIEAMLARGADVNIVLPYEPERFIPDSVAITPQGDWVTRFRRVLAHDRVRLSIASHGRGIEDAIAHEYCNEFLFGIASIRASQLDTELSTMAVWDGAPGDGGGGTASAVTRWRSAHLDVAVIDIQKMHRSDSIGDSGAAPPSLPLPALKAPAFPIAKGEFTGRMRAILFADVPGFSKLPEEELPLFVRHFLEAIGRLIQASGVNPLLRDTWGDAIYFVFNSVREAGSFALDLRDLVAQTDWPACGFTHPISLRIALHYGPVYAFANPVSRRPDFLGTHISRAARIEPITPQGQVYASEAFAAISFADRLQEFTCEYVGQIGLAKDYGTYPTYHIRRARSGG